MREDSGCPEIRRGLAAASITAVACIGLACGAGETPPPPTIAAPPVMVADVEVSEVTDRIEATGQLVAKAHATIAAQVNGQITAILAEEGDAVPAGHPLLEIDPQRRELELLDAQARLAEARAQVAESERNRQRVQTLSNRDAASQSRLDEAETQLSLARSRMAGAEAQLGLARRALEDSTVRAPFAGLVARRSVSAGEYVTAGLPLFEIVALDPIEVHFSLAEVDSSRVRVGQEARITVAPYPGEAFVAHVTVISPTIDPATRTLRVKGEIDNADERLRPGLFVHADLGVSRRSGVTLVPEEAVVLRADGSVIFTVVEDSRVRRSVVRTGLAKDGMIEIVAGVSPHDRVVVRGHSDLTDGSKVSIRTRDGRPVQAAVGEPIAQGTRP